MLTTVAAAAVVAISVLVANTAIYKPWIGAKSRIARVDVDDAFVKDSIVLATLYLRITWMLLGAILVMLGVIADRLR